MIKTCDIDIYHLYIDIYIYIISTIYFTKFAPIEPHGKNLSRTFAKNPRMFCFVKDHLKNNLHFKKIEAALL